MCAMARALMANPRLLLIDEMSLGLAPVIVDQLLAVLSEIRAQGVTVLLVEQDVFAAFSIADRAYVMETGRIVREGPVADLADDPDPCATPISAARSERRRAFGVPPNGSWDDNHNARREARDFLRNAAEYETCKTPASAPPHHNGVYLLAFHGLDDHFRRVADTHPGLDVRCSACACVPARMRQYLSTDFLERIAFRDADGLKLAKLLLGEFVFTHGQNEELALRGLYQLGRAGNGTVRALGPVGRYQELSHSRPAET